MTIQKNLRKLTAAFVLLIMITGMNFANSIDSTAVNLDAYLGVYRGAYMETQGHTGLTLVIYKGLDDTYEATFDFYSVPDNPKVPKGQFIADVTYNNATREILITGKRWVERPSGYQLVNLSGIYEKGVFTGTVSRIGTKGFNFEVIHQVADNAPSSWATNTVNKAVLESLIPLSLQAGYRNPVSRSEFTQLIIAAMVQYEGLTLDEFVIKYSMENNLDLFVDTKNLSVSYATQLGIVAGYGNNKFGPNDSLTREQAGKILRNLLRFYGIKSTGDTAPRFLDTSEISSWAKEDVSIITSTFVKSLNTMIMSGDGQRFNPKGVYTKEQSYLTIYHTIQYIKEQ
jgi:S-layer homology domain.